MAALVEKMEQVRELSARGWSNRRIARLLRVNRGTVQKMLDGSYTPSRRGRPVLDPYRQSERDGIVYFDMNAPVVWCDVCRANVRQPCLACQIRARGSGHA